MTKLFGIPVPFTKNQVDLAEQTGTDRKDDPEKQQKEQAISTLATTVGNLQGRIEAYNPDKLVGVKGVNVYKNMLRDDQVKGAFMMKLGLITGRKMTFQVNSDDQKECAEFFQRNIDDLICGTWRKAMKSVMMGKAWGYSMSEKIFRTGTVDGSPRWILDRLKAKPWYSFNFITDKYGNLTDIEQDQNGIDVKMDPTKFVRYISMPEFDDIYGESDLKAAYRPFWEKDVTQKLWNIYLERIAGGFVAATPNEMLGNSDSGERAKLEKVLSSLSGTSGVIGPKGYDIKIEMPRDVRAYEYAIDKRDVQIARALLLPNFLGFTEQGGVGSNAQSATILNMFLMLIEEEADYLADVLNEEIFAQLAWWNFGLEDYPRAKFTPYTTEQKREIATIWIDAVEKGAVTNTIEDELTTRGLLLYPTPDTEDLEAARKAKAEAEAGAIAEQEKKKEETSAETKKQEKANTPTEKEAQQAQQAKNSEPVNVTIHNHPQAKHGITPNAELKLEPVTNVEPVAKQDSVDFEEPMYTERIDFASLESRLDTIDESFYNDLSVGTDKMLKEVQNGIVAIMKKQGDSKEVDKKKTIEQLNNSISAKTKSKINRTSQTHLKTTYNLGRRLARKSLNIAVEKAPAETKDKLNLKITLTEAKACMAKDWSVMHFVDGISVESADAWFSSAGFSISGDLTETMVITAANIITNGIRDEVSTRDMVKSLAEQLPTLVPTTPKANRVRLENIVRTNMSTIFTQSQLAYYADPALNGFVEAMEYSAILDKRTTPVCIRLDGAKYAMDASIWSNITPPNHYMCRSVLIPVTILDPWRASTRKYAQGQLPHTGFGKENFPTKYTPKASKK